MQSTHLACLPLLVVVSELRMTNADVAQTEYTATSKFGSCVRQGRKYIANRQPVPGDIGSALLSQCLQQESWQEGDLLTHKVLS